MAERQPGGSVEDVAKHLGFAKDTVCRWIEFKALPTHKVARLWKFRLTKVDEWVRCGEAIESGADEC